MRQMTIPTDAELNELLGKHWPAFALQGAVPLTWLRSAMREAIAKWGQPLAGAGGEPVDPHAALRAVWVPGYKWEWTSAKERQWWAHNGEPEWDPDWQYRLAPPPQAVRETLTDAQCDAIYEALDAFGREADTYEYGLPYCMSDGETLAKPEARKVIRQAAIGITKGGQHGAE